MSWMTTQPTLIGRLRSPDDHDAWRRFDATYGGLIIAYARRRGLDLADAEDVRQIVLLSLVKAMPGFRLRPERGRFRSYLGRVVGNAIQRYRKRPHRQREVLELDDALLARLTSDDGIQDAEWEDEWVNHHLRVALRRLRESFDPRSVAVFNSLLDGEHVADVAASMRMTPAAVHKVKQRVRDRLKLLVAEQIEDEDSHTT